MFMGDDMKIIKLTELQFKNYSKIHSQRNYFQTIEYGNFITREKYKNIYLGLLDDEDNVVAATLLCYETIKNKYNIGYIPGGFLLDLNKKDLTKAFIEYFGEYLKANNFIYARVYPYFSIRVYDKKLNLLKDKEYKVDNLKENNVTFVNYKSEFSKYHAILKIEGSKIEDVFSSLSYKAKREIKKSSLMGIKIYQGTIEDIETFYDLIKDDEDRDIEYYKNLATDFSTNDNKFEVYFAKINTKTYLNNYLNLEKKEKEINYNLNNMLINNNSTKILQKKMASDSKLASYRKEIIKATNIHKEYPDGTILSTVAIIRNNREINFVNSGYNKDLKQIYSISSLKWEIIKKYYATGYKTFDIGEIPNSLNDKNSPYFGLFVNNSILSNRIIEYSKNYDIIANKYLYTLYASVNTFINSLKKSK